MKYHHPVAVVTGGAGALGAAIGRRFVENGDTTVLLDIDAHGLDRTVAAITAHTGRTVIGRVVDIADPAAATAAVAAIDDEFGRLDRLVNNAAVTHRAELADIEDELWDRSMAVNLRGPMALCRAAMPIWNRTRVGHIVNIGSRTWQSGGPSAYVTSKAGLVGLTRSLAVELGSLGITCNAVAPSMVITPFTRGGRTDAEFDRFVERHTALSPLGRLATEDDVVDAVEFLASAKARFVTGEVLHVCGGAQLAAAP